MEISLAYADCVCRFDSEHKKKSATDCLKEEFPPANKTGEKSTTVRVGVFIGPPPR